LIRSTIDGVTSGASEYSTSRAGGTIWRAMDRAQEQGSSSRFDPWVQEARNWASSTGSKRGGGAERQAARASARFGGHSPVAAKESSNALNSTGVSSPADADRAQAQAPAPEPPAVQVSRKATDSARGKLGGTVVVVVATMVVVGAAVGGTLVGVEATVPVVTAAESADPEPPETPPLQAETTTVMASTVATSRRPLGESGLPLGSLWAITTSLRGNPMTEAVIVATARTPIGRAFKGSLTEVRPDDMSGFIIDKLMDKVPEVPRDAIEDVIWGAAGQAGEQSMNLGRNAAALAGLPDTVPGTTVNRFCASSLQTIRMAFHAIKAGEGDVFISGGSESVSRAGGGFGKEHMNPRFVDRSRPDYVNDMYIPMGFTAENVAEKFGISRERMDEFGALSQNRAVAAQDNGFFDREITPITTPDGTVVSADDGPRRGVTVESMAKLKPVFKEDGKVTAGNACPLNDGAAAVLVMSDTKAAEYGLTPLARIVASSVSALAPEIMGVGPIDACRQVLDRAGMSIGDIDVVELNEAFAAQVLPVCDEVGISIEDQLNPHGGAIALGHPFGMTGARIMTTLINDLQTLDRTYGLETMCIGGGQGMAMIIERLN